jgi:hypothetical protein
MQSTTTAQTITLHLPIPLYQQVQHTARTLRRTVEEVLLDAVATALPPLAGLPPELTDDLSGLAFLNDATLWQVARSTLPPEHHQQMDELLARKGQGELTATEQQTLDRLLLEYQTLVLRRGQAAVLLQRRGYDVSDPAVLNRLP